MKKIKEWFLQFFLVCILLYSWGSVAICVLAPLVLGSVFSPWWFLSWCITIPAACTTIIIMSGDKE